MNDQESTSSAAKSLPSHHEIHKVEYSGDANEFVTIGGKKYHRHELMSAFGGTLNPGATTFPKLYINPAPVGLSAFALTTFILSLYNARAFGITVPNVVLGLACFYGGIVQFVAGVAEFFANNTFGGTALTSYGAFWMSFAALYAPAFGIGEAYGKEERMMQNGVGFFLIGWAIFTFMLVLLTLKSTVAFFVLFFTLALTFTLLGAGELSANTNVSRAGGVMGVITAVSGWYNAYAGVANRQNSYLTVRAIKMPGAP